MLSYIYIDKIAKKQIEKGTYLLKKMKRIICAILVAALLCTTPPAAGAQGEGLAATDVSRCPAIRLAGGFHWLYFDEHTPEQQTVFNPAAAGDVFMPIVDGALEALKALDFDRIIDRIYDEILLPLVFTMPVLWNYVPQKDYEAAKKAMFSGKPEYAGLVEKLDDYHMNVMDHADEIILGASDIRSLLRWWVRALPIWVNMSPWRLGRRLSSGSKC